jgi:hypothetical protein
MGWPKGKPRAEETKQKITAWMLEHKPTLGTHISEEAKRKIGAANSVHLKGNKYRLGIPTTEAQKQHHSEVIKAKWQDPEFREKILTARANRSEEEKQATNQKRNAGISLAWQNLDEETKSQRIINWQKQALTPEALKKRGATVSGAGNPAWKGGGDYWGFTKELTDSIRERDKFTCQKCGRVYSGGKTWSVHHKDFDTKNNAESNLITLCTSCHRKIHKENLASET